MAKVAIVYVTTEFNHSDQRHTAVACGDRTIYVRTELVDVEPRIEEVEDEHGDISHINHTPESETLDMATPGEHETFNTIEF